MKTDVIYGLADVSIYLGKLGKRDYMRTVEVACSEITQLRNKVESLEKMVEDQEERIAIMTEHGLWNRVENKPPKKREYVLVYNAGIRSMSIRRIVDNDNFMDGFLTNGDSLIWEDIFEGYEIPIIPEEDYWMELPEPPKDGGANEID